MRSGSITSVALKVIAISVSEFMTFSQGKFSTNEVALTDAQVAPSKIEDAIVDLATRKNT